jgi:hypothetical protein
VALKTPLSAVTSSFLAARSTASSFRLAARVHIREPPVATAILTLRLTNAGRTALLRSCPPGADGSRTGLSRFEPVAGRAAPKRSSPSVQAIRIKPGAGTCSLGQDGLPETAGRPWRPKKSRAWPRLLSDKSRRTSKRNKVLTAMFSLKRAKARRQHWAGTPWPSM